jgi:hypothetical protein
MYCKVEQSNHGVEKRWHMCQSQQSTCRDPSQLIYEPFLAVLKREGPKTQIISFDRIFIDLLVQMNEGAINIHNYKSERRERT